MHGDSEQRQRRWAAWAAVLFAHGLVIQVLRHLPAPPPRLAMLERLMILNLSPPEPAPAPAREVSRAASPRNDWRGATAAERPGSAAIAVPAAPSGPATPPPPIDWDAERQQAAASQGREVWRQLSQRCRDAAALRIYPPECHRYVAPDPWEPEEKRFGHEGVLPYVRLGRCVVGLGFWGCAVGKKPPPNGHAFDDMRDPDRPGAIPDNGGYQAPPEAREPLH